MKKAIVLEANDVRDIIAKHFKVNEKRVIKSQYSYTVIFSEEESEQKTETETEQE